MFARPLSALRRDMLAAVMLAASCSASIAGCARSQPDVAVLDQAVEGQPVFATTKCVVPSADGKRCDQKTCKTDDKSNCEYFASRCLATGHSYTGTKEAGTCNRAHPG